MTVRVEVPVPPVRVGSLCRLLDGFSVQCEAYLDEKVFVSARHRTYIGDGAMIFRGTVLVFV